MAYSAYMAAALSGVRVVLQEFVPRSGAVVPHLLWPKHHVSVDPETQGGRPVITGTRVPFDAVAELVKEGIGPEQIADYYPGVTATPPVMRSPSRCTWTPTAWDSVLLEIRGAPLGWRT